MACPACSEPVPITDDCIVRYFEGKPDPCGKCGAQLDWWAAACRAVESGWVPATSSDKSWQSMVDAFESYSRERYPSMIAPANTAVESCLSEVLGAVLPSLVSKSHADDLQDAAASGSHQLKVLLALVAHYNGIAQLPPPIHEALDRLRALRNDSAHGEAACNALDAHAAAELLCGALFGLHYVRYVERRLPRAAGSSVSF
jgi:hypothetical protein